MSTFTEWNGPQNNGPSPAKITELIESFNQLSSKLQHHIDDSVNDPAHPHAASAAIQDAVNNINTALNSYLQKTAAAETYLSKSDASRDYVTQEQAANFARQNDVERTYETKADAANTYDTLETKDAAHQAYNTIATLIDNLRADLTEAELHWTNEEQVATYDGVIKALDAIKGYIKAHRIIDFTKWQLVSCQFAGTGGQEDTKTNGLYVIGKLSHNWEDDNHAPHDSIFKAARAFIKYENGHPFDAIIDMTATRDQNNKYTGSIIAQVSKKGAVYNENGEITENGEWSNLRFHLVHATSYDNTDIDEVYLCLSADGLWKGSPYLGDYSNLRLHVAGINFIPLDDNETKRVTLVSAPITWTAPVPTNVDNTTIYSNISAGNIVTDSIIDTTGKPVVKVTHTYDALDVDHREVFVGDPDDERLQFWRRPILLKQYEDGTMVEDKFATIRDMQSISSVPIGTECYWPRFEFVETGTVLNALGEEIVNGYYKVVDPPEGWIAEDGSIQLAVDYPDLAPILGADSNGAFRLPKNDFCMIKARLDTTSENSELDVVPVLNYQQLVTLLKALRVNLAGEISRSIKQDKEHSDAIAAEGQLRADADNVLLENDKRLAAKDIEVANKASSVAKRTTGGAFVSFLTGGLLNDIVDQLDTAISGGAGEISPATINTPNGETVNVEVPEPSDDTAAFIENLQQQHAGQTVSSNAELTSRVETLEGNVETINTKIDTLTTLVQQLVDAQNNNSDPGNGGNP